MLWSICRSGLRKSCWKWRNNSVAGKLQRSVACDARQQVGLPRQISVAPGAETTDRNAPVDAHTPDVIGHAAGELVFPREGYLGIDYTDGIIFIQVTWNTGRSTEVKKAFYRKIADDLHAKAGVRKQDVFINLVEVSPENWSFGNGEMQYAPKQ